MALGPGKGRVVRWRKKETRMDGTPIKARHALAPEIARLVTEHRPGGPLERDFYVAAEVFAADLARIFQRHWIFAGYAFQVARPGDFFTYKIGTESVIVTRDHAGTIRAFHNVCRHRGSRICRTEQGNAHRLVCPYHRWTARWWSTPSASSASTRPNCRYGRSRWRTPPACCSFA
jgi:hypothetical protein